MATPTWTVSNSGSFASVKVQLPPHTEVHCESDAVVTFSQGIQVKGYLSGGFFSSLARFFFTNESFFTTKVENSSSRTADVMMAPSDPGGVVLHTLMEAGDDLLLTSGAYVASDARVNVSSEMQSRLGNSLLSGTGLFLLRASGRGLVAFAAYGSVHQYTLQPGDVRAVDNGHLVAWSAHMKYRTGLASGGARGIMDSMTSGEGLMCFFEGPGTLYLQSHKPSTEADTAIKSVKGGARRTAKTGFTLIPCVSFLIIFSVVVLVLAMAIAAMNGGILINGQEFRFDGSDTSEDSSYRPRTHRSIDYDREKQYGYRGNEF
jgi:uncharacterized protein (TIGR00266 family)